MYEYDTSKTTESLQTHGWNDNENNLGYVMEQRRLSEPEGVNQPHTVQNLFMGGSYIQRKTAERSKERVNNTGMPDNLKNGIESMSGYNMDDVRVHYNSEKPAQFQALAYAQGTDVYVARGQEKHLPHEAWHVVQQKQGRVSSTMQIGGIGVNDNQALEQEADVMGARAASGGVKVSSIQAKRIANACVQRSDFKLLCEAKITYIPNVSPFQTRTVRALGRNDPQKTDEVLETFRRFRLNNLYNIEEAKNCDPCRAAGKAG